MDTLVTLVRIFDVCWILASATFWYVILKDRDLTFSFWGSIIGGVLAYAGSIVCRIIMGNYLSKWFFMTIDIATIIFLLILVILALFPKWDLNKRQEEILVRVIQFLIITPFIIFSIGIIIRFWNF